MLKDSVLRVLRDFGPLTVDEMEMELMKFTRSRRRADLIEMLFSMMNKGIVKRHVDEKTNVFVYEVA